MNQKIQVFINRKQYDLEDPIQTGTSLKKLAGIPLGDVLFLSLVARIGMETEFPLSPSGSVRRCVRTQAVRARSLCSGLCGRVGSP